MGSRKVVDRWVAGPLGLDWLLAAAIAAATLWMQRLDGLDRAARLEIYQAILGVAGALLGFYMATIAILLGLLDSRRPALRHAFGGGRVVLIQPIFFSAIRATALVLLISTTVMMI